jgi:hypothetical protein
MRPTVKTISMDPLHADLPEGTETEVVFVQPAADAAFDRARRLLNRSNMGALPKHLTVNCVQGMWDGVCALGVSMGTRGNGYLDRVYKALLAFMDKYPQRAVCIWIDEAQMLTQRDREGIFRLIKYVCEELGLNARICVVLRRKQIRDFDGKRWRWVWRFPTEGERIRQISRCWNFSEKGLDEGNWAPEEEAEEQENERRVATA